MSCIYLQNPMSGFVAEHDIFCAKECGDVASVHVRLSYWCGNLCPGCARKMRHTRDGKVVGTHRDAVITDTPVLPERMAA